MTDNNKSGQKALSKKIIAFMAVMMMIVSPMAIVVAVGDSQASESNDVELTSPIKLEQDDKGVWTLDNQGLKDITFDDQKMTLTFNNVDIVVKTSVHYAVGIIGDASLQPDVKLVFKGQNHITIEYSVDADMTPSSAVYANQCSIKMSGYDENSSLTLTVGCNDNVEASLIECEGIEIKALRFDGGFKGTFATTSIVNVKGDISISGSTISADVGASTIACGINTRGDISIIDDSDVSIHGGTGEIFIGLLAGDYVTGTPGSIDIETSNLQVFPGEYVSKSAGLEVVNGMVKINGSNVFVQGIAHAMALITIDENGEVQPNPISTGKFEANIKIEVSKELTEKDLTEFTGDSISLEYKSVKITDLSEYSLSYDANGGSGDLPDTLMKKRGETEQIPNISLTKEHYTFDGWSGSDGKTYKSGDTVRIGYNNITLTAKWKEAPSHTLSFDENGGTGEIPARVTLDEGQEYIIPECSLTYEGFAFVGWMDNGGNMYKSGDTYTMGNVDDTLTAQWAKVITHKLSFDTNGGTGKVPESINIEVGCAYSIPECSLTKAGFAFVGWMDNFGNIYRAGDKFVMGDEDVVLTAQWYAVSTHTVHFDGNGADKGTMPSMTVKAGDTFKLPMCGFSKFGYSFGGWSVDGVNILFKGSEVTMGDSDVTYKAIWIKNDADMRIDADPTGKAEVDVDSTMKTLTITIDGFTVFIDEDTVQKMQGHTFYIQIRMVNSDEIYEIVAMVDGESQKVPFNGDMLITLPYDSSKGTPSVFIKDGTSEVPVEFIIGDETLSFKVGGSCQCIVKYTAEPEPVPPVEKNNDYTWAIVGIIIIMVMVSLGIFLLAYHKKDQRKH